MDFNLYSFGKKLREIRKELCLTQNNISKLSGINSETIRRIENGKVIPKFETLELLSPIYKRDLNNLFLKYRIDNYSYFYEIKNRLEAKFDRDDFYTINIELKELKELIKYVKNSFYKNLIEQLILLTKSVILYKKSNNNNEALNKLIEAITITIPNFDLNNYNLFVYSPMDIRILMNMAFVLNKLNHKKQYLEIMKFCINSVDPDDEIYPKLCHNLAGVYRRNKKFEKALKFSNIGIKACQENRNLNGLNLLFYGKGVAEYKLNNKKYMKSLKTSITLCEAFGQDKLRNTIINNCNKVFNISL